MRRSLVTLNPYARYRVNDRSTIWGLGGVGSGELSLDAGRKYNTGLKHGMAAFGGMWLSGAASSSWR